MSDYILSCCSTADLSKEHFDRRDIHFVPFHYKLDGRDYPDDLGQSMSFPDFYEAMRRGADTSTSQVNISEYLEHFEPFLEAGKDVLHVCLSSGISGTWNACESAAAIARERYPERKILVVDSMGASSGYGLFMDELADRRDEGYGIEELADWAVKNRLRVNHVFYSTDLSFYVKGGRISRAAGLFGGVLRICPLLDMDEEGRLAPREKPRGKNMAMKRAFKKMEELAENGTQYSGKCYISNSDCYEDARALADMIEANFPNLKGPVEIYSIGTTIGSHTGPGTVALFFIGKERDS